MLCRAVALARGPFAWGALLAPLTLACGAAAQGQPADRRATDPRITDPAPVVARFAAASRQGDHRAVYRMLSASAQRSLGADRVEQLVAEQRQELARNADNLTAKKARTEVDVQARFVDGDTAQLSWERGELRVASAAALPSHATSPQQALVELRSVLQRRSYPGLLGVLTRNSAAGFEAQLDSLVEALADAPYLQVEVEDNRAVISLPQGHKVELWKEDGLWKVHDFE
jgi:hypothetical protein